MANPIQSIADYRGTFEQNQTSTLFLRLTTFEGQATDPESISIDIVDESNESFSSGIAEKVVDGFYIHDWKVALDQSSGTYTVTWTYVIGGVTYTEVQQVIVAARSGGLTSSLYSDRLSAIRMALTVHLSCAQAIPVYDEQGIIEADNQTVSFNFPRWNQNMMTRLYLNGKPVTEGATINYFKGKVIFANVLTEYDTVNMDYNFRWFDDAELDRFLQNAVSTLNNYPPVSGHNLYSVPDMFIPHTLYGAARDAIRHLLMCLQFQEPQEVFGGPENAKNAFAQLETLKKNFEEDFKALLEQKKFGSYVGLTKAVVTPEYTLPGGRSRWFRHLFKNGSGS